MDTLPLPPSPSLEQYRKRAKSLVTAATSKDPVAVRQWARAWIEPLAKAIVPEMPPFVRDSVDRAVARIEQRVREWSDARRSRPFALADAQHLIAEAHGFGIVTADPTPPSPRPEIAELVMIAAGIFAAVVGQISFVRAVTIARRDPLVRDVLNGQGPRGTA